MLLVEINDFNALIDNKSFFDQPVKNKQEAYEKLIEMPRSWFCRKIRRIWGETMSFIAAKQQI